VLQAIAEDDGVTQRRMAQGSSVALGLVNSYLKRCVRKGLVKVKQAPPNRYLYYLTPKGFAEKSRLTAEFFTSSFRFYREASGSCARALEALRGRGYREVSFSGLSELAEIATVRAAETSMTVIGIFAPRAGRESVSGVKVYEDPRALADLSGASRHPGWLLTETNEPGIRYRELLDAFPVEAIEVPDILRSVVPEHFERRVG